MKTVWKDVFGKTIKDVGRNDKCPCGLGKKFKKCCIDKTLPPKIVDKRYIEYMKSKGVIKKSN